MAFPLKGPDSSAPEPCRGWSASPTCNQQLFIHLSIDGHLGWFNPLAVANDAAMNVCVHVLVWGFPGGSVAKNLPAMQVLQEMWYSIPGSGRCPGGGHGIPLQYSCLENPMDRGDRRAAVCGATKSQTQLKQLSMQHAYTCSCP